MRHHASLKFLLPLSLLLPAAVGVPGATADPLLPAAEGVPECGSSLAEGVPVTPDDLVFKMASFNILHSDTLQGDESLGARLELEADALAASGADVITLQEVTRNAAFNPDADDDEFPQEHGFVTERLAMEMSERTGNMWYWCFFRSNPHVPGTPDTQEGGGNPLDDMAASFGNFPDGGDFSEGLAIISRWHIDDAQSHRLLPRSYETAACIPPDPVACNLSAVFDSRQVLWADIAMAGNGNIDVFDTHIAHGITALSDTTKLLQVQQVLDWIEQRSDPATPDILAGDFNSTPDTDRVAAVLDAGFTDTWAAANGAAPGATGNPPTGEEVWTTAPSRAMGSRIDYVFSRGCTTTASVIIGDSPTEQPDETWLWPSDHLGVNSTLAC